MSFSMQVAMFVMGFMTYVVLALGFAVYKGRSLAKKVNEFDAYTDARLRVAGSAEPVAEGLALFTFVQGAHQAAKDGKVPLRRELILGIWRAQGIVVRGIAMDFAEKFPDKELLGILKEIDRLANPNHLEAVSA